MHQLHHTPEINGELRDDELDASYAIRDGIIEIEDVETARTLVENHQRVEWYGDEPKGTEPSESTEDEDGDGDGDEPETCDTVKADGEVCGRDLPCPYHSED